ncbi:hypothetical protein RclHR1_02970012 [Rhizophagus clarus]|uniref:Transcription initiation factor IIB n=1 Tax=Rhizophagus clarus TaxID=94130 RepID=A0A2Z6R4R1_9GLOM|nr:hypothetical protein RclHR1_02970012 [Rhizophagus clarus]GES72870.1 transcription initiation factor IIB [Rhizophagus clarus]
MLKTLLPKKRPSVEEDTASKTLLPDLNIRLICPDCKNNQPNLIEEYVSGDLVCGDCGLVLGDRIIDTRAEWRTFSNEELNIDSSRVGAATDPLLEDSALETIVSSKTGNTSLSMTHVQATINKVDRLLKKDFTEIDEMCHSMDLNKEISDTTKQLYKRSFEEKLLRGRSKIAIFAACIYSACRIKKVARSFKEICDSTQVSKRDIAKCFKILIETFELNVDQMTSEDLMIRFSYKLNLPKESQNLAIKLSKRTEEFGLLSGRNQNTIAAACIYLATKITHHNIAVDDVSKVSGTAARSVKSVYNLLYSKRENFKDLVDNIEEAVLS